jgi:membrane fusion protein, copper/silver efflux system
MNNDRPNIEDAGARGTAPANGDSDTARTLSVLKRRERSRAGSVVVLLVVAAASLLAGTYWHQPLSKIIGVKSAHDHAVAQGASRSASGSSQSERKVKYYWDPMQSPPYISDKPGVSPMGMQLIPVYEDEVSAGPAVTIDPVVVQNMGVRVAEVGVAPLRMNLRAVGYLQERTPDRRDINLRVSGWIERLDADTEGMFLKQGAPLFTLYSPELTVGIESLITARRSRDAQPGGGDAAVRRDTDLLYETARQKLSLWGLSAQQIDELAKLDRAPGTVTFNSPITGHLVEKMVFTGSAVKAGDLVMRLADRSTLWLDIQVFEQQLPLVQIGQEVRSTIESMPGKVFTGKVAFLHPHVDPVTRTATVRVELPNKSLELRQGMYATARMDVASASPSLQVPREAIIDTGERRIAFVVAGEGRFEPRLLKTGLESTNGAVEVLGGLAPGENVVVSGQFLLDSESRLREAIQKQLALNLLKEGGHSGHSGGQVSPSGTSATAPADAQMGDGPSKNEGGHTEHGDHAGHMGHGQ